MGTSCLRRIPLVTLPGPFPGPQLPPERGTMLPYGKNSQSSKQTHIFLVEKNGRPHATKPCLFLLCSI